MLGNVKVDIVSFPATAVPINAMHMLTLFCSVCSELHRSLGVHTYSRASLPNLQGTFHQADVP